MPLVQRLNGSNTSYSGTPYLFTAGTKKLHVKVNSSSTINYPLTTDTSASQYCKFKILVSAGKTAYLAKAWNRTTTTWNNSVSRKSTYTTYKTASYSTWKISSTRASGYTATDKFSRKASLTTEAIWSAYQGNWIDDYYISDYYDSAYHYLGATSSSTSSTSNYKASCSVTGAIQWVSTFNSTSPDANGFGGRSKVSKNLSYGAGKISQSWWPWKFGYSGNEQHVSSRVNYSITRTIWKISTSKQSGYTFTSTNKTGASTTLSSSSTRTTTSGTTTRTSGYTVTSTAAAGTTISSGTTTSGTTHNANI